VQLYEQIRRVEEREGLSIRALSQRFGVHRRDVRAALASPLPVLRKMPVRPAPKMDGFKAIIDAWLEADRLLPRKQRHTARRVWQRLVDEHDADVGESTVRRYVKIVRERQTTALIDVAVPQHHPLGAEAEVDFGSIHVYLAGVLTEAAMFIMRLSASGRAFPAAYLNEAQEVFLDGHVRAFDHFGGTPGRIRYDNLKAAVAKVLKGRNRIEPTGLWRCVLTTASTASFVRPAKTGPMKRGSTRPSWVGGLVLMVQRESSMWCRSATGGGVDSCRSCGTRTRAV